MSGRPAPREGSPGLDRGLDLRLAAGKGGSILEALLAAGEGGLDAPCGGKGRCGKCRVRAAGALSAPDARERAILSAAELAEGWRLACLARLEGEARVERPAAAAATIIAEGPAVAWIPDPPIRRITVSLPPARLDEQRSDEERLLAAIALAFEAEAVVGTAAAAAAHGTPAATAAKAPARAAPRSVAFRALPSLAVAARGERVEATIREGEVIAVARAGAGAAADARRPSLGIGADIGTTTVVCYLVDLDSGAVIGTRSGLNGQRHFGADVISRIAATIERPGGLDEQRRRVAEQLTAMSLSLVAAAGAEPGDLLSIAIAGNTTMLHLLAGVPPAAIAVAPFSPVFTAPRMVDARELGLDLPPACTAILLPGVSGYVGADIVSGIAALGMAEREETALLLDIGTNGELALGGAAGILCCATAAGPAFEGAGISMGMGGVEGAIDSVWHDGEGLGFSTIGGLPARGLCGSGVLDALAVFLEAGLVDETGRVLDAEEAASLPAGIAALRDEGPTGPRLALGGGVFLSQADVRQLQLAIAAIAAGIDTLLARSGRTAAEVDRVFLAGGFGSRLSVGSAVRTGLIPRGLRDRVVIAGNSSGAGAVGACLSRSRLAACGLARSRCRYVELSSDPSFNEAYVERMLFPETR